MMSRPTDDSSAPDQPGAIRVQRFLARAGVASRRQSETLIEEGRVCINGELATRPGMKVVPGVDVVEVDGARIESATTNEYLVLNKPAGYVTTMSDPQGRSTVAELLPDTPGLFPVGRLDLDTTGVLMATTDGDLAHRLLHPSHHVSKTYRVAARGLVDDAALERLRRGVDLDDGPTAPAEANVVTRDDGGSIITLTLREGRKRQVKRMFREVGHPVMALHRESFGPITDAGLTEGQVRTLSESEIAELFAVTGMGE